MRQNEIKRAERLQQALGEGFMVWYDAGESGTTEILYNGQLIKRMRNSELMGALSITEIRQEALTAQGKSLLI